ncbi:MAG: hypothetical protein J3K34DRAFT_520335 [Monoraphidium minutum]|nr:MAG: hypothetical protein J3K34DRAFT_520335 [Monoraphidium minutum]
MASDSVESSRETATMLLSKPLRQASLPDVQLRSQDQEYESTVAAGASGCSTSSPSTLSGATTPTHAPVRTDRARLTPQQREWCERRVQQKQRHGAAAGAAPCEPELLAPQPPSPRGLAPAAAAARREGGRDERPADQQVRAAAKPLQQQQQQQQGGEEEEAVERDELRAHARREPPLGGEAPDSACGSEGGGEATLSDEGWFKKCRGCGAMTVHEITARGADIPFCPRCKTRVAELEARHEDGGLWASLLYVHDAWSAAGV